MKLIFDLDGTLFQTLPCEIIGIRQVCQDYHLQMPEEKQIAAGIGLFLEDFFGRLFPEVEDLEPLLACFRTAERQAVLERGILFPGVDVMLEELTKAGHTLILCSSGSPKYVNLVLESTDIKKYFKEIYSARNYGSKPAAMAACFTKGEAAVVIGDTISDLSAARKNFLPTILVTYGYGTEAVFEEADFLANNTQEIITLVNQI